MEIMILLMLPWVVIYMHGNNWSTSAGPARGFPGHRFYFGDSRDQNPNSVKRLLTLLLGCLPGFSGPQLSQKDSAVILDSGSLFDAVYSPFTPRNWDRCRQWEARGFRISKMKK